MRRGTGASTGTDLLAALPHLLDAAAETVEIVRIAADDDQVSQLAVLDRAELSVDAEEPGRLEGRRAEDGRRSHAGRAP